MLKQTIKEVDIFPFFSIIIGKLKNLLKERSNKAGYNRHQNNGKAIQPKTRRQDRIMPNTKIKTKLHGKGFANSGEFSLAV